MNTVPYPTQCTDATLIVLNQPHKAVQVYHAARSAPEVRVEIKDLLLDHPASPTTDADPTLLDQASLLIYKYNGRWLVLTGMETVRKAIESKDTIVTAALISTPSLKKCRILPAVVEQPEPEPVTNGVSNRWGNNTNGYEPRPSFQERPQRSNGFRKVP